MRELVINKRILLESNVGLGVGAALGVHSIVGLGKINSTYPEKVEFPNNSTTSEKVLVNNSEEPRYEGQDPEVLKSFRDKEDAHNEMLKTIKDKYRNHLENNPDIDNTTTNYIKFRDDLTKQIALDNTTAADVDINSLYGGI